MKNRQKIHLAHRMMTDIELLMLDGCTKSEAEKHLERGAAVFTAEDLKTHFDDYMAEWEVDEEERGQYREMLDSKTPVADWGVVETGRNTYYIMYCL